LFGSVGGCCPSIRFLPCCPSIRDIPLFGSVGFCPPECLEGAFLPVGSESPQMGFMLGLYQLIQTFKLAAGKKSFTGLDNIALRSPSYNAFVDISAEVHEASLVLCL